MGIAGKGEPAIGLDFYELLRADDEFCAELGRAILAAGRLESALVRYFRQRTPEAETRKASLGKLIHYAEEKVLLSDFVPVLRTLNTQRNYLAHSVHALFSGMVEETILPRSELLSSDVASFTDRAWQLKGNLEGLAQLVEIEAR